jgi:hypothetical protein
VIRLQVGFEFPLTADASLSGVGGSMIVLGKFRTRRSEFPSPDQMM